jgi:hypothetical protein
MSAQDWQEFTQNTNIQVRELTPNVESQGCPGIVVSGLKSKPVFYSWLPAQGGRSISCQNPQLSPNLEKLQVWFPYLAWAFVGGTISAGRV